MKINEDPNKVPTTSVASSSNGFEIDPLFFKQYFKALTPLQMSGMSGTTTGRLNKPEYKSRVQQRIAIPINGAPSGYLEMVTGTEGDMVDFVLTISGRAAIPFTAHRKDLEALTAELSLAKLAK